MKPKKNIRFCHGCHRSKMFFETKSKADNFIKYNKNNILEENGYAPVRSYYCEFCCGYHVTSKTSIEVGERLDKKEHEIMMQFSSTKIDDRNFNDFYVGMVNEIAKAESMMYDGDFQKIDQLRKEFDDLRTKNKVLLHLPLKKKVKFMLLSKKIEILTDLESKIKELNETDDEGLNEYLSGENPSVEKSLIPIIEGLLLMRQVLKEIEVIQIHVNEGDIIKAQELKNELCSIIATRKNVRKKMRSACNYKINEVGHIIAQKKKEIQAANPPVEEEIPIVVSPPEQYSFNSTMVELINILEEVKTCFDEGDIDSCEIKIDVADYLFSQIDIEDANTEVIKQHLEMWKQKIYNYNEPQTDY